MITLQEARERLGFHCGTNPHFADLAGKNGFLQSLESGHLNVAALADIRLCVDVVSEHLKTAPALDRRILSSLWGIIHFSRARALDPESGFFKRDLLSPDDQATLSSWLQDTSFRVAMFLDGNDP